MAFLKKVGNFLTQSTSNPSLFAAIRSMSTSSKIFVGGASGYDDFRIELLIFASCVLFLLSTVGLSYSTDDMSLSETFSKYGEVVEGIIFSCNQVNLICIH